MRPQLLAFVTCIPLHPVTCRHLPSPAVICRDLPLQAITVHLELEESVEGVLPPDAFKLGCDVEARLKAN